MSINAFIIKGVSYGALPFFVFFFWQSALAKEHVPSKWALGLGAGWLQDYPGADQGRIRFLPFPVYRGNVFRIDRVTGVSGKVYDGSRTNFSWNFIFQFPTESEAIPIRQGMPDLDWLLSLGPQVTYTFWQNSTQKFYFRFPVRFDTCTNFSDRTRFCGLSFNPGIRHAVRLENFGEFIFRIESFSHSSEYHKYFFEVPQQFATAARPAYHPRAGFLGFVTGFFHTLPFKGWELATAFNIYEYSLNVNKESPLFRQTTNYGVFFAATIDFK